MFIEPFVFGVITAFASEFIVAFLAVLFLAVKNVYTSNNSTQITQIK